MAPRFYPPHDLEWPPTPEQWQGLKKIIDHIYSAFRHFVGVGTQGDVLFFSDTTTIAKLPKSTTATRYLSNTGTDNNPAWAQVNLANGVTGDLPFANLAQGVALSVLGVTGNAIADLASIAAGSDHQVLRRSGTVLAFGAVNLAQAAAITGDLPFANLTPATAASRLLGRGSASGAGDFEEITLGSGLAMTGTELSATAAGVAYTDVAHNAANFTAPGATWTVEAADQVTFKWRIIDQEMVVIFTLDDTSLDTAVGRLEITIPDGRTSANLAQGFLFYQDAGGTSTGGHIQVLAGETVMRLFKSDLSNWSIATNTTIVRGTFIFEVQP